jgi:hypothetical protein
VVRVPTDEFSDLMPRGPVMPVSREARLLAEEHFRRQEETTLHFGKPNGLGVGEIAAAAYVGWCGSP